jgi:hypothetical protein
MGLLRNARTEKSRSFEIDYDSGFLIEFLIPGKSVMELALTNYVRPSFSKKNTK